MAVVELDEGRGSNLAVVVLVVAVGVGVLILATYLTLSGGAPPLKAERVFVGVAVTPKLAGSVAASVSTALEEAGFETQASTAFDEPTATEPRPTVFESARQAKAGALVWLRLQILGEREGVRPQGQGTDVRAQFRVYDVATGKPSAELNPADISVDAEKELALQAIARGVVKARLPALIEALLKSPAIKRVLENPATVRDFRDQKKLARTLAVRERREEMERDLERSCAGDYEQRERLARGEPKQFCITPACGEEYISKLSNDGRRLLVEVETQEHFVSFESTPKDYALRTADRIDIVELPATAPADGAPLRVTELPRQTLLRAQNIYGAISASDDLGKLAFVEESAGYSALRLLDVGAKRVTTLARAELGSKPIKDVELNATGDYLSYNDNDYFRLAAIAPKVLPVDLREAQNGQFYALQAGTSVWLQGPRGAMLAAKVRDSGRFLLVSMLGGKPIALETPLTEARLVPDTAQPTLVGTLAGPNGPRCNIEVFDFEGKRLSRTTFEVCPRHPRGAGPDQIIGEGTPRVAPFGVASTTGLWKLSDGSVKALSSSKRREGYPLMRGSRVVFSWLPPSPGNHIVSAAACFFDVR